MSALEGASPYIRAESNLAALGLDQMAASLPDYMRMVSEGDLEFCAALAEMTAAEVAAKEARVTRQRIRSAGFPYEKTLADFDWSFQPSVPRARVEELATLRFMERAENVLLVGSPGVGKTHLAIAVGIEAVRARREVRFMDCARLVDDLRDAQSRGILKKRLQYYAHSKLLIIDELGYLDIDEGGADLLFQLVSTRYEQRSTIITTNVGIGGWAKVFGDEVAASAIADRVCHHCHVIKITGRSYRLKDLPADSKGGADSKLDTQVSGREFECTTRGPSRMRWICGSRCPARCPWMTSPPSWGTLRAARCATGSRRIPGTTPTSASTAPSPCSPSSRR